MTNATKNKAGAMALQALGFRQPEPYVYAWLPNADTMRKLFVKWKDTGFAPVEGYHEACINLYVAMTKMRKNAARLVGLATQADLNNFYRLQHTTVRQNKPSVTKICPYPMIQDDYVYLCLPLNKHPETPKAVTTRVVGIKWAKADTENSLQLFMPSLKHIDKVLKKLMKDPNIVITNQPDLLKARAKLQQRSPALFEGTR